VRYFLLVVLAWTLAGCDQLKSTSNGFYEEGVSGSPISLGAVAALDCHITQKHDANIGHGYQPRTAKDKMDLVFAGIDLKLGKAQMIGNSGASEVPVISSLNQMIFPELTPSGNMNVTSVFFYTAKPSAEGGGIKILDKRAFVVHSRHVLIFNEAVVSQWVGYCDIKTD